MLLSFGLLLVAPRTRHHLSRAIVRWRLSFAAVLTLSLTTALYQPTYSITTCTPCNQLTPSLSSYPWSFFLFHRLDSLCLFRLLSSSSISNLPCNSVLQHGVRPPGRRWKRNGRVWGVHAHFWPCHCRGNHAHYDGRGRAAGACVCI